MLITIDQLKAQSNIEHEADDELLEEIVRAASAIVLDYLKRSETDWQDSNDEPQDVPYLVQAATKLVAAALYENREGGDDLPQPLSQTVKDLLQRYRDPALA